MIKLLLKRLGRVFVILTMIFMLILWIVVGFTIQYVLLLFHKLKRGRNGINIW